MGVAISLGLCSPAFAHDGGSWEHTNHYLRAKVIKLSKGDKTAPGCDLVAGKCRGQKRNQQNVHRYFETMRGMIAPPPPEPVHTVYQAAPSAQTSSVAPVSSGGGCGDLPAYIVQRESGGNPNAVSPNGQYIGCAQVDRSHFNAGGSCAGLGYTECVNKLWDGGNGASNWPTAANPPG